MDEIDLKDQLAALVKLMRANTAKMEFISDKLDRVTADLDGFIVKPVTALAASSTAAATSMVSLVQPAAATSMVSPLDVHDVVPPSSGQFSVSSSSPATSATDGVVSTELANDNNAGEHCDDSKPSPTAELVAVSARTAAESSTVTPVGVTSIIPVAPVTCSTECPSSDAIELTPASTPAAAPMPSTATVDGIPVLTAAAASDETFTDKATKGAASMLTNSSPGSTHSGVYASVFVLIPSAPTSLSLASTAPTPWPPPYQYLIGCDSSKSRPAPWPSFGDLPGGMHLPEPRPRLQKSEEGILSGLINRDNQVAVQHIDDSVSCGVHRSSFALFQWEIAGQLGGSANYASNNRTLDGKEVLLTWSHFLRIQILALPSMEISFETDPMSLQSYTSFSIGNCFGVEWFNGILLQAYLLSQFIGRVTSCGFELLQWQIAWSRHLQCSEITSAELKENLLPDMSEETIPANFVIVCCWAVGVVGWSVFPTSCRSTETSILVDSVKLNESASTFRTVPVLELQQSMYKLFSEGTCQACKVRSYRKFFDPVMVNLGHLSSYVIQHAIHGASHCDDVDFDSSFPVCTNMWMGQSKESGNLIQWLANNRHWKIPWKMCSNCSPLPSSNSFNTDVPRRVTCETMSILQLFGDLLGHFLDAIRQSIPELTNGVAAGCRHISEAGPAATTQQAGQPVVPCSPLLDHYWSVLTMSERLEQYQTFEVMPSSYVLFTGKHLCAPWDPGGGILQVFCDCGLRASRVLRRGECHVPSVTWAERWTGPAVSAHTKASQRYSSIPLYSLGYIKRADDARHRHRRTDT